MTKRYLIYTVISIICIIAIFMGVYYQLFGENKKSNLPNNEIANNKPNSEETIDLEAIKEEFESLFNNKFNNQGYETNEIEKISGLEDRDIIYTAYDIQEEKDEEHKKYNIDIKLPVFNVKGDVVAEFNKTTQSIFADKANDILTKSEKQTIYGIEYVAYLNEKILSLVIKSTLKEGNNPQRIIVQTYNYNIETGEKVTLNEIIESKEIDLKEVNEKIEKQVKEANKQAEAISEALSQLGQSVYMRDLDNAMYVTDNVTHFFVGLDGQIYIVYPYGNTNFTSEIDIIKI